MTEKRESVKVINAALDETPQGEIILRGVVSSDSLKLLKVDDYQREVLSNKKVMELKEALRVGSVPAITLGMRGETFMERDGNWYLSDDIYIIDGLQRVTGGLELLAEDSDVVPHLGAEIHFGTNQESERALFSKLNISQSKLSSNVTLRNAQYDLPVMKTLFNLTTEKAFVMGKRVCWNQSMKRDDLISAVTFVKIVAMLHSHAGPGRSNSAMDLAQGLEKIVDNVGRNVFADNVRTFFDIVDQCWGVQRVAYREGASYMRVNFLVQLARVLSDHPIFWEKDRLCVNRVEMKKLSSFPVSDPEVVRLASSGGMAAETLYVHFVRHINSGKRTRRLVPRRTANDAVIGMGGDGNDDE